MWVSAVFPGALAEIFIRSRTAGTQIYTPIQDISIACSDLMYCTTTSSSVLYYRHQQASSSASHTTLELKISHNPLLGHAMASAWLLMLQCWLVLVLSQMLQQGAIAATNRASKSENSKSPLQWWSQPADQPWIFSHLKPMLSLQMVNNTLSVRTVKMLTTVSTCSHNYTVFWLMRPVGPGFMGGILVTSIFC